MFHIGQNVLVDVSTKSIFCSGTEGVNVEVFFSMKTLFASLSISLHTFGFKIGLVATVTL